MIRDQLLGRRLLLHDDDEHCAREQYEAAADDLEQGGAHAAGLGQLGGIVADAGLAGILDLEDSGAGLRIGLVDAEGVLRGSLRKAGLRRA